MKEFETATGIGSPARVCVFIVLCFVVAAISANAAQLTGARVTRVIKDVKLLPNQQAPRPATESENITSGTAVRTGHESRAELTFTDQTITRLGANTIFSFNEGSRQVDLGGGAILVQVPNNGAEAIITTEAVTAGITGGTALFEANKGSPTKFLVLEGTGRFFRKGHPEEAVILHGGEMIMMMLDGRITRATRFNAKLVFKTAKLITAFPPLPNEPLILAVIDQQAAEGTSEPSNPPGLNDPIDTIDQKAAATVAPPATAGAKFGPPRAITSPDPYHITNGTQINTDPKITTAGVTDMGKLYRGRALDGPLATWSGSSPSSFDMVNNFESNGGFNNPSHDTLPIAAFLFAGLQLDGNPTVSNPNNVPTLGFASVGGITATPSGEVFTFTGMNQVAFIALNGSIDFSGISFANFGELFIYARGAASNLTLAAPISNLDHVTLRAEQDVQVNTPVTLNQSFKALAGNNFVTGTNIQANHIAIESLGAINLTSSAQLVAMLDSVGATGQIVIIAHGSDATANIAGLVQADSGEVDIRSLGVAGRTDLNSATLHGDVVKVSALGTNGSVNIGSGNSLNADTVLKLYAPGSNGTLNFLSNVTLSSPSNILAANTLNISPGVVVTIPPTSLPAQVYTNNPNYFGYGGAGSPASSGTFGGAGAHDPQPLANRPPLGDPGHGP